MRGIAMTKKPLVPRKDIEFEGDSLAVLKSFPKNVQHDAGFQIDLIAIGKDPNNFSPISRIGPGAMELRIWDEEGTFRIIYVAKFSDAVHILHCFKKKTQVISKSDIKVATDRYKSIAK